MVNWCSVVFLLLGLISVSSCYICVLSELLVLLVKLLLLKLCMGVIW